jgi:pyruvate formate lyase activating enzyme
MIESVAMDIKADFENYGKATVRKVSVEDIKKSIILIYESDIDYEFRTTCVPSIVDKESIRKICSYFQSITKSQKPKKYVLQQFVGKRENDDNFKLLDQSFADITPYSRQEMRELVAIAEPFFEEVELRFYD